MRTIAAVLLLSGCATSTPISTDGQHLIECDGAGVPWSACFKKANSICAQGYDVISQDRSNAPLGVGSMERKNIMVQCR